MHNMPSDPLDHDPASRSPVPWGPDQSDLSGKTLMGHGVFLADLLQRLVPDWHVRLGRATPFEAADIATDIPTWLETQDPKQPRLTTRHGDILATLKTDGRPVALLHLELQATYDATMAGREANYVAHIVTQALDNQIYVPRTRQPLPVLSCLVHTGTRPWFQEDRGRGTWLLTTHPEFPHTYELQPAQPMLALDFSTWHALPKVEPVAIALQDLVDAVAHLYVLHHDTVALGTAVWRAEGYPALRDQVEPLRLRTADLLRKVVAVVVVRDKNGTYRVRLVHWVNKVLLPIWGGILRQQVPEIKSLEELTEMNSVLQQVEAAVEENWNIGLARAQTKARTEGRAEGRAEGRTEGRTEGRAEGQVNERIETLLDLAVFCGALTGSRERQEYREQLGALALDRLPAVSAYLAHLQAFPEGADRAAAAQRFLDDLLGRNTL